MASIYSEAEVNPSSWQEQSVTGMISSVHGFTSYDCDNNTPQTQWLKTTISYCLTVLEAKVLNQGVVRAMCPRQVLGKDLFQASLSAAEAHGLLGL